MKKEKKSQTMKILCHSLVHKIIYLILKSNKLSNRFNLFTKSLLPMSSSVQSGYLSLSNPGVPMSDPSVQMSNSSVPMSNHSIQMSCSSVYPVSEPTQISYRFLVSEVSMLILARRRYFLPLRKGSSEQLVNKHI